MATSACLRTSELRECLHNAGAIRSPQPRTRIGSSGGVMNRCTEGVEKALISVVRREGYAKFGFWRHRAGHFDIHHPSAECAVVGSLPAWSTEIDDIFWTGNPHLLEERVKVTVSIASCELDDSNGLPAAIQCHPICHFGEFISLGKFRGRLAVPVSFGRR